MEIINSLVNRWYAKSFARVAKSMDKVSDSKNFNSKKAKQLLKKYGGLIKKTCNDLSRTGQDRNSWSVAIAHAYEPSQASLVLRYCLEVQNN